MAMMMLKRVIKHGFIPDYILMDKWFISEDMIRVIRKLKKGIVHLIAACKMDRRKYFYQGKQFTAKQILAMNKTKIKHCRSLKMLYIPVIVEYKGTKMFLFFNKSNRRKHWELLVTTDLKLGFKKALETYSIRWTIEVFFKESKQHLGLGKCQSNDFDAQIADTTITLMRYILMNLMKRFSSYETLGEAFSNTQVFMLELNLSGKIWEIFVRLCRSLCDWLGIDYNEVISVFFQTPEFQETIFRFFDPWEKVNTRKEDNIDNVA
ncbi:MAG: transposase [Candidatus Cloacimonadota bacterium]|nr:transposase [Candidatus Cloacimonadota bacterium]